MHWVVFRKAMNFFPFNRPLLPFRVPKFGRLHFLIIFTKPNRRILPMKKQLLILSAFALMGAAAVSGQGLPVRYWSDDMPQHTFSLGIGPTITGGNSVMDMLDLGNEDVSRVGFDLALRYDWAYFRGYEVSLATGLTYIFSNNSHPVYAPLGLRGEGRVSESLHYAGINALNTKMWFGSRVIWDVSLHAGYLGGAFAIRYGDGERTSIRENGFAAGFSTGIDCLITAWLGVGIHINVMTGLLYTAGSSEARDYSRANVRVGVVYCF